MEACSDWRCVIVLAKDTDLRLDRTLPWRLPLRATSAHISSCFGYRVHPVDSVRRFHAGVDIAAPEGTAVLAAGSGVATSGSHPVLGRFVRIDHHNGFISLYGHLGASIDGKKFVQQGELIGTVGSSGTSTGPHLHWTVKFRDRAIDPLTFQAAVLATLP